MEIGDKITELRKKKEMSQEMLANKLNISFQAVSKWENNISYPDIKLIPKIADVLDCSIGYLFGENEKSRENIIIDKLPDDDTMRIVIAKGHHILTCDEIEAEGKKIQIGDISNCGDVIISGNVGCNDICNCADINIRGNLGCNDICNCTDINSQGSIGCDCIANCVKVSAKNDVTYDRMEN